MIAKLKILTFLCLNITLISCNQEAFDSAVQAVTEVEGIIKNAEGKPMPGVNIVVNGFKTGSISDLQGYYKLKLPDGATDLDFSFIGFESQNIVITNSTIDVVMQEGGVIADIPEGPYFKVSKAIVLKDDKKFFVGRVYNRDGEMLSGVNIQVMYANDAQQAVTDAQGQFNIELKDDAMVAYFEKDGYESNVVSIKSMLKDN